MHPDRAKTSNEFPQIPVWRVVYVKNIGRKIKKRPKTEFLYAILTKVRMKLIQF